MSEEREMEKQISLIETLTRKIEDFTKACIEKKVNTEETIKENPIAYVLGAFAGGVVVGYLIGNRKL